jgi:hypothetical protein
MISGITQSDTEGTRRSTEVFVRQNAVPSLTIRGYAEFHRGFSRIKIL